MSLVPSRTLEALQFCEDHYLGWVSNAAALGLTNAQALGFKAATEAARAAYNAAQAAVTTARSAGVTSRDKVGSMRGSAGDTIRLIRAFAEAQANPNAVYTIAGIPPPATPQPREAPGQPEEFRVALNADGSLTLRWKCKTFGFGGTVYTIRRAIGGAGGAFSSLGVSGSREFTDVSIPSSAATSGGVTYIVRAQRSDAAGEDSLPFTVLFGASGGGLTIAASFTGEAMKVAA